LYAVRSAPGCKGRWLLVGASAWVCEEHVRLAAEPPLSAERSLTFEDGLPYRYFYVGENGALGYERLSVAEEGVPDAELEPGFSVAVVSIANKRAGDPFGLTTKRRWIPMRDLSPAKSFLFRGADVASSSSVAWVYEEEAHVFDAPGGRRLRGESRVRFERLDVLETLERARRRWFRIGDRRWVSDRQVRAPSSAPPPSELSPMERWIDVDLKNQILTAHEGQRTVFATLVSTGKGAEGSVQATPKGTFRIWVKLQSSDMDNLEHEDASRYYAIQDVPWVMFFDKGYGLHGTFWHRSFGKVRSHGCVNLPPLDAQRLFYWTSPRLPSGWTAALPNDYEKGTLVRVR
jgi:hypothetical protein